MADKKRYCIVEKNAGDITVKLNAPNNIMLGADFKIYDELRSNIIEQWKMSVDPGKFDIRYIRSLTNDLHKKILIWSILACSNDPDIYSGIVSIEFSQIDDRCGLTVPAKWNLTNIPPCKLNATEQLNGSLSFIVKDSLQN